MIKLSGLSICSKDNTEGDIQIICTGLRPGEKLYEELLIDDNSSETLHPLIYKGYEKSLDSDFLWNTLKNLEISLNSQDIIKSNGGNIQLDDSKRGGLEVKISFTF